MIKDIHLALEVKTFFGNSTPMMGLSMESSTYKPELPTNNRHRHHWKRGEEETCTQQLKAKLEPLRLARLTRHDFLSLLQRLQAIKIF
jgi:hypothetical protein